MRWIALLVLVAGRCQGFDEIDVRGGAVGRDDAGDAAPGPRQDGRVDRCLPMSLGASPRACADTWAHAAILYPSCTDNDPEAGYRARCGDFDASIVEGRGTTIRCFYDPGTGNLAASLETGTSTESCNSYDPALVDVPEGACAPLGAAACTDGG